MITESQLNRIDEALSKALSKIEGVEAMIDACNILGGTYLPNILRNRNAVWHKDCPRTQHLAAVIKENEAVLTALFFKAIGVTLDWQEDEPCALVNKLLSKGLGIKVKRKQQRCGKGKKIWVYRLPLSYYDSPASYHTKSSGLR